MRCSKCGTADLGWKPTGSGPCVCVPCGTPEKSQANLELRGQCIRNVEGRRCHRDSIAGHWDESPHPTARYCYEHAWRSWAIEVDLMPYRRAILQALGVSMDDVERTIEAKGYDPSHDLSGGVGTKQARVWGYAGEWAACVALDGIRLGWGKGGDVLIDGYAYEVKTAGKNFPFRSFKPRATINRKHYPPQTDLILCIANPVAPLERAWVLGWIEQQRVERLAKFIPGEGAQGGYHSLEWGSAWHRPHTLMRTEEARR